MGAQQSHLLYQVPSPPGYDKSLSGLLWIEENGMKIPAIYREYKDKETETKSPITLIYCGSHYNDLGACSQWLSALHYTLRINVIAFDYPGYGLHTGEPSENDLYASASAVFFYVKNTLKVPTKNIVLLGKSLGTAVAVNLAYEIECGSKKGDNEKFGGIVLVSPFSSLSAIVGSRLKFTKSDLYDNVKKFEKIQSLTLVAHGENDEIIDIKIARKTASKISNLWKLLELDCGHLDIDDHNDFMDILIEFIDHIGESIGNFTPHAVKPVVIPSQYQKEQTVDNWLEAINLSKYAQQFLINGYYNMDVVKTIEQIDLQAMDISSEEDQQIILNSINDLLCGGSGVPKPEEPKKETSENAKTVKRVSYGPMDVNPESFNQVLVHYNCSPAQDSGIPSSWDEFMAFASSVNIPYWEDEKDVLLAKGFFGEVIKSTWKDKPVIKRKLQYKRNQFRKFCQEAVLLCQLKHPNLVEVVGACMEKNVCPCLITEYITGGNLTNFVLSKKKLNDKELFKIANGITRGLQFLHSCIPPIVHRDLTPNNIFVTEDLEVKLTDFGMGRPPSFLYMAPELFSKQPANIKGDIYSLGLIFYFLVTGTLPFEGLTAAEAAAKATKLSVRPAIPQTVPAGWKSLITSCWHKNPLSRPTTEQILQTLRKLDTEDESPAETPELIPISLIESPDGVQGTSEFIPEKVEPKNINSGGGLLAFQLKSLVNDPKYSDFTVRVGNEKFAAHRAILAARSDLFAAQIEESENGELTILEDVASPSSVLCLLQFLYSGFLDLSSENLLDVMNAANNLNITQAVDICREFLSANGVPIKVSESSNENTERIQDVQESLMAAEHNIQNIETLLNSLNEKLETVTSRMNSLPTL